MTVPRVELVVVGDELLSGRIADSNSAFVSRRLAGLGLVPSRVVRVQDDGAAIEREVGLAASRSGLVLVMGGLGPTPDDRTLEAVAGLVGRELVERRSILRRVEARFCGRGMKMPKLARRQALVPKGARLLHNPVGMVPGMALEFQGSLIVLLPGVPAELEAIVIRGLEELLRKRFRVRPAATARIRTFGLPEATIASRARSLLGRHPGVSPAFYPLTSGVDVVLQAHRRSDLEPVRDSLVRILGNSVYEVGDRTMEQVLGELLRGRRLVVASAESCTGGRIGDRLTSVPGSSEYFAGGLVVYSNQAKVRRLGVKPETLNRYGAVSAQTVREMSRNVRRLFGCDVGIAVSGIAGPGGATKDKPVGLVYVGVSVEAGLRTRKHLFSGSRMTVKERAAMAAMDLCRLVLMGRGRGR
ncbi:MAG: CinA family nicotinamide mononucleotide deamidase-related protein [candidate division WOR-3 bacterium]|nr:MAG: CinA family nicotinamide mononucleotide deamidase-related protein [candidate division WOR-3 bacterium]